MTEEERKSHRDGNHEKREGHGKNRGNSNHPDFDRSDNWRDMSFDEKKSYLTAQGIEIPEDAEERQAQREREGFEKPENFNEMSQEEKREYAQTQGVNPDNQNAQRRKSFQKNSEKFLKTAKKGKNYKKFSGAKKIRKKFKDENLFKNSETNEAVHFLQERGVIKGYKDGSFQPKKGITRAESLKILIESTGTSTEEVSRSSFNDIKSSDWFAGYVEKAKEKGFIKGYKDGSFQPNKTVNQAELLKIAFNSFGIDLIDYETSLTEWYGPYLQYAFDNNLLDKDEVSPETTMTRETFSKVIYRLIQQQEAL
jgi:hypothetical protein